MRNYFFTLPEYIALMFFAQILLYYFIKEKAITLTVLSGAVILATISTYISVRVNQPTITGMWYYYDVLFDSAIKNRSAFNYTSIGLTFFHDLYLFLFGLAFLNRIVSQKKWKLKSLNQ